MPLLLLDALCLAAYLGGCDRKSGGQQQGRVTVYTSVDEPVARPIVRRFEERTGIKVNLVTDTEAMKTAGLVARLEAEKGNPQCDVWWGNEVFRTINLAEGGLLESYESPAAGKIPSQYKDARHRWAGTALRARVMARATSGDGAGVVRDVASIEQLGDAKLKGKVCMATPTAGTTSGHMAALYTLWGAVKYEAFLKKLKENEVKLLGGNSVVAEYVGKGSMWVGLTDNDDVEAMTREGGKLEMVLPDQQGVGTLTIPCTVGLVKGAKNAEAGKKVIDYLLSEEVEGMLLETKFARYSVFKDSGEGAVKGMKVGYAEVAKNLRPAVDLAMKVLVGRE